jgi:hypothetical protein
MRTGSLICIAGALVIGPAPATAAPAARPDTQDASKPPPTPLSGFDVVATKPKPTSVSGVDVVAKRSTKVSGVEVTVPLCPGARKDSGPAADGFRPGNSIVVREGRFDDRRPPSPKVVSSFPAKGDVVRPGLLVLRVTFDRPMTCLGLLQNHLPFPDPCPPPLRQPMISRDKRTFLTVCMVEANRHYGLWLDNFASVGGRTLPPYELVFDSSDRSDIATLEEAVAQDTWLRKAVNPGS